MIVRMVPSLAPMAPVALLLLLCTACAGTGGPDSETILNENRELHGIVRAQERRIDELTRQRNELERKLESDVAPTGGTEEPDAEERAKPDMTARTEHVVERFRSDSDVEVEPIPEGYRFVLREKVVFGSASAKLSDDGRAALQRIADELRGRGSRIVIEGHTDNVKLVKGTTLEKYPRGNIELSVARALAVWEYLVTDGRIDEPRLAVVGYGEHRPRLPNDSERNRYRNRRVEIRVSDSR